MARLDDAIASVAYILDALRAYRSIVESGDCNNCKDRADCPYSPGVGKLVRYNCPFYRKAGGQHGVQDH